jgi:hypothetical protein
MEKSKYYEMLTQHDWYYLMSDNPREEAKGKQNEKKLYEIASSDNTLRSMFNDFLCYTHSGKPFATPQRKRPELSDYE